MKKLLLIVMVFLFTLPAMAQTTVLPARLAQDGATFTTSLPPGVYVNYSNWDIYAQRTSAPDCLIKRLKGFTVSDGRAQKTFHGVRSMGIFEILGTRCIVHFELLSYDHEGPRSSTRVALRTVRKHKSVKLSNNWTQVHFSKGRYSYLGGHNGYVVDNTRPRYQVCMGDSEEYNRSGPRSTAKPTMLIVDTPVKCWIKGLSVYDKRTIQFAKW